MAGSDKVRSLGVWSTCTWEGAALSAWLRQFGYPIIELDPLAPDSGAPFGREPSAIVVSGHDRTALQRLTQFPASRVVVLGGGIEGSTAGTGHRVPDGPDVVDRLRAVFTSLLGDGPGRVSLSRREREVLTTYVLGATVEETAAAHFVANSTVRTHYRRVTARYTKAGYPTSNKAQLLLRMVADGWLRLDDAVATAAQRLPGTCRLDATA